MKIVLTILFLIIPAWTTENPWYDFENSTEVTGWTMSDPLDSAVAVSGSTLHATAGSRSLCLVYQGGQIPFVKKSAIPSKVTYNNNGSLLLDVYAGSECVIGIKIYQDSSKSDAQWGSTFSRYEWYVHCVPGLNKLVGAVSLPSSLGKFKYLEIGLHLPNNPDTLFIDNIRQSTTPPTTATISAYRSNEILYPMTTAQDGYYYPALSQPLRVLGRTATYSSVLELAVAEKSKWKKPPFQVTLAQVDSAMKALYDSIKVNNRHAVLARFRQGDSLFNPAMPSAKYTGWKDCYIWGHVPAAQYGLQLVRGWVSPGSDKTMELLMRHRSGLIEIDVSSIKPQSKIFAARLSIIRTNVADTTPGSYGNVFKPTFWWAEPCRRAWNENQVNAIQYDKKKYWKETAGRWWNGNDPDFAPLVIAYGQSTSVKGACVLDFTEAVKYWNGPGSNIPNHGFFLCSVYDTATAGASGYLDNFMSHTKEASSVLDRPCLYVIYDSSTTVGVQHDTQIERSRVGRLVSVHSSKDGVNLIISATHARFNRIAIYDVSGKRVFTRPVKPGPNASVFWEGSSNAGERQKNGTYVYTLKSRDRTYTGALHLMR